MDAGMSERFRMPMTAETDGAGAFVGGAVYHSCLESISWEKKKAGSKCADEHKSDFQTNAA